MSLRIKIFLSFLIILSLILALLWANSIMANSESSHMKKLLWIHHQHRILLNLKIAVNNQLREAQEIFIYGKTANKDHFAKTTATIKGEVDKLILAGRVNIAAGDLWADNPHYWQQREERLTKIKHSYEDIHRQLKLLIMLMKVGRKAKAQDHFVVEINRRFAEFFNIIDEWISSQGKELNEVESGFVKLSRTQNLASIIGLGAILVMIVAFLLLFVYLLGPRLRELFSCTERISKGDFSHFITEKGNDEFTSLARSMNEMMKNLASSRKKLLEQSYYSGMADLVSGVLHNVKNSLSPVVVDLEIVGKEARKIQGGRLPEAAKKLAGSDLTDNEKKDLLEYIELYCANIDERSQSLSRTINDMSTKMTLIDRVISDHSKYAGAERPIETVSLEELFQDCLALVRGDYLEKVAIKMDKNIEKFTEIKTHRIVMVQILANLVMNAIESILRSKRVNGLVEITAELEEHQGRRFVHIKIIDNGEGIRQERLTEIFKRGVSTKHGSFGLGLHWCANSMESLSGKLTVESKGVGQGACMNVLMPIRPL